MTQTNPPISDFTVITKDVTASAIHEPQTGKTWVLIGLTELQELERAYESISDIYIRHRDYWFDLGHRLSEVENLLNPNHWPTMK